MFMSGDALSICQAVKANRGKVIVQVDRLVDTPSRPRNAIIPGCLVDAIVVAEPEKRNEAYTALTGSFEIPYKDNRQQHKHCHNDPCYHHRFRYRYSTKYWYCKYCFALEFIG